jgi:hypothetical protein
MYLAGGFLIALSFAVSSSAIVPDLNAESRPSGGTVSAPTIVADTPASAKSKDPAPAQPSETGKAEDTKKVPEFLNYPGAVLSFVASSLLLILLAAFLWAGFWEFRRRTIIIDPIDVPKDLGEKGYTLWDRTANRS